MTKPFVLEELVARVHTVLRRRARQLAGLPGAADLTLAPRVRRIWCGERPVALTTRAFDLFKVSHAARRAGPHTHSVLLERVWGYEFADTSHILTP